MNIRIAITVNYNLKFRYYNCKILGKVHGPHPYFMQTRNFYLIIGSKGLLGSDMIVKWSLGSLLGSKYESEMVSG